MASFVGTITAGTIFAGVIAICSSQTAYSLEPTIWNHNGSRMQLVAKGTNRQFLYDQPRRGMEEHGVRQGTLLFHGTALDNRYMGTAYIFRHGCGSFPYRVSGPILNDYKRVVLHGMAPRIRRNCQISGHIPDTLTFVLVESDANSNSPGRLSMPREFQGKWGSEPNCSSGIDTTISSDEITLWRKFVAQNSPANEFYGACTISNLKIISSSVVAADLADCDHPGHIKMNATFERADSISIKTPFGTAYRCN